MIPAVEFNAPAVNPAGGGLYAAATLADIDGPFRQQGGVNVNSINCSTGHGTWDIDPCLDPGVKTKDGNRPPPLPAFEGIVVWGYDECDPQEGAEGVRTRATQNLRLHEQTYVESFFADRLKTEAAALVLPAAADIIAAVSAIETELGERGIVGTIHASRKFAAYAASQNLLVSSGGLFRTPLGHLWAFGGGYNDVLGNQLITTGQTFVWRSGETVYAGLKANENTRFAVAERQVVVGYECKPFTITVTP